jgi:DNA-binding NarL/FixJ family response regulator
VGSTIGAPAGRLLDALVALATDTAARINERAVAALEEELALRRGPAADPDPGAVPRLTRREREVLALLADGCSNREIADRLLIAEPTVKGHVGHLMRKLGAPSRLRVVARAGRLGLL